MVLNEKRESNFGLGPFSRCDWRLNVSGAAGWRGSRATSNNFPPKRDLKNHRSKITYLPIEKFIIYGIEKGRCFMVPNAQMVSDFQEIHPQDRIPKT